MLFSPPTLGQAHGPWHKTVLDIPAGVRHEAEGPPSTPVLSTLLEGFEKKKKHPLVLISTLCTCICLFRRGWPEKLLKI